MTEVDLQRADNGSMTLQFVLCRARGRVGRERHRIIVKLRLGKLGELVIKRGLGMDRVEHAEGLPIRPGMKCLLDIVREHRVDLIYDKQDWEEALALAEEEHILPWVAHVCVQQASVHSDLSHRVCAIERKAAVAALYWSSELKNLLRAFEQRNIVVIPLKGPFLAERLYGDAARRVSYDLDLLVFKVDLTQAEAVLSELGFTADTPDDYHCQWRRGSANIELHHNVENPLAFNFHISHVLRRAQPAVFQGVRCWQLAPADELLFLCLHGVRHAFERLSLILDLCLAFEKLTISEGGCIGPQMAERSSVLVLGLAMARRLHPEIGRTLFPDTPIVQRNHLERLADRLWCRLLTQASEPLDWRGLHSFYLEMEPPSRRLGRHFRHLRILLKRIIKPDYEFAAQFGCHRGWQVRLLRPLRLVRDVIRVRNNFGRNTRGQR